MYIHFSVTISSGIFILNVISESSSLVIFYKQSMKAGIIRGIRGIIRGISSTGARLALDSINGFCPIGTTNKNPVFRIDAVIVPAYFIKASF